MVLCCAAQTFATDLLTRAVFFGQTEVNALLEVCGKPDMYYAFQRLSNLLDCGRDGRMPL